MLYNISIGLCVTVTLYTMFNARKGQTLLLFLRPAYMHSLPVCATRH